MIRRLGESGVVQIWLLGVVLSVLALAAYTVDLSRKQLTAKQLQDAADAASLAASLKLDGTREGWKDAKRAAIGIIRNYDILTAGRALQDASFAMDRGGKPDILEPDPMYQDITGEVNGLTITVERGVYWASPIDPTVSEFRSLEGRVESNFLDENNQPLPIIHGIPTYIVANSVRVTVGFRGFAYALADLIGFPNSGAMSQSSVSTSDEVTEQCVVPVAIPLCQLLAELNPSNVEKYQSVRFNSLQQCPREFIATEANPTGTTVTSTSTSAVTGDLEANAIRRAEGLVRSESYHRWPLWGGVANKRGLPIGGVLGIPSANVPAASKEEANPSEFAGYLQNPNGCIRVKLGTRFKPLMNSVGIGGLYSDHVNTVELALRNLINSSGTSFQDAFGARNAPRPNYPHVRYTEEDRKYRWPTSSGGGTRDGELLMSELPEAGKTKTATGEEIGWWYTNPLCHDYGGNYDSLTSGIPANNPEQARSRPVTVMLIAPSIADDRTGRHSYCDFNALFSGAEQNTTAPLASTDPVVVGFVRANLFDFNIRKYPLTRTTVNPELDKNPREFRLSPQEQQQMEKYVVEHAEWSLCKATPGCFEVLRAKQISEPKPPDVAQAFAGECFKPPTARTSQSESCSSCSYDDGMGEIVCSRLGEAGGGTKGTGKTGGKGGSGGSLYGGDEPGTGGGDTVENFFNKGSNQIGNYSYGRCPSGIGKSCCSSTTVSLSPQAQVGMAPDPNKHCFPMKKPGCFPVTSPECWEGPKPRLPQYGCGGLRLRLDCEQELLTTPRSRLDIQPALVQ